MKKHKWIEAPKLNFGRFFHSSCCLGEHAYVFGGDFSEGAVESLNVDTGLAWAIIKLRGYLNRWSSTVAILNHHAISLFGSERGNDGYVIYTN